MNATPPWLRDALRFALTATASTETPWHAHDYDAYKAADGGDLVDPDDPGKDPRFRKLVEAILYGRKFVATYNYVLVGVLLVFTLWHWSEKLALHMRKRSAGTRKKDDDTSSAEEAWSSSSSTIEGSSTPPNTAAKKVDTNESSPLLPPAQRASRNGPGIWRPYCEVKALLQYQPPRIPVINKTLPTNAVSLLVLAWLGLIIFYNFHNMSMTFMSLFVFADRCGIIFIANLPLLYILAAKNQPIKMLTGYSYESLNIFHRRVGEIMCLEAFLHCVGMWLVWFGLLRHLGFTLAKFLFNRVVLLEDDETVLLSANWEVNDRKNPLLPKNMTQGWKPNDHIFISVPSLSRKHGIQSHPFTIFSAAPKTTEDEQGKHAWLTLLIRPQSESGFSYKLLEHARETTQARVRLDGPYGSSRALDLLESSETAILIAGGSGIAVAYPLLYALLCPATADPESALSKSGRKVKLLWITHSPNHRLWIPEDKLKELEDWGLDVVISPPTALAGEA
ncbi:Ferric reductase transmembrane component [Pyrenophora tritici-repentis]|nr:Ferric reductase transmembrane component [Pyrenophora tritici-repentis]